MATDYILFIHGVNVRDNNPEQPTYADELFELITRAARQLTLKKIPLYWGNVPKTALDELSSALKGSSVWDRLWFKDFRLQQILQFAGDAALYISRHVGSQAVEQLARQAEQGLAGFNPQRDRLHLVTHSWGTVILFDILFARRWDDESVPGFQSVQKIRQKIFGIPPEPESGIRLSSVHTLGAPIALFSLISIIGGDDRGSTHDISPRLKELIANLSQQGIILPWLNFIHPGDPIAWPLEQVLPKLVDEQQQFIRVKDILSYGSGGLEFVGNLLQQTFLSLVNGGSAHGSYWTNDKVAQEISSVLKQTNL